MEKKIMYVGLDVDDKNFTAALIASDTGELFNFKTKPQFSSLRKKLSKFEGKGYQIKLCYEATYIGFSLKRQLDETSIYCDVISPSQIPELASDRVKTDRLDSEKLAKYYKAGLLTVVHAPTKEDEDDRRLIRSRHSLKRNSQSLKKEILSLCRAYGKNYKQEVEKVKTYWTQVHRKWLSSLASNETEDFGFRKALEGFLFVLDSYESAIESLNTEIETKAKSEKYKKRVEALGCIRGLSTLSAMTLITEIGDVKRFAHPNKLVSFSGLDISEYSSGGKVKKFGITKMGNKRIRTALVEACQRANKPVVISRSLKERRKGKNLKFISLGDRCMRRLKKKSNNMLYAGKPINKIKVACAREMVGFIWESLNLAEVA